VHTEFLPWAARRNEQDLIKVETVGSVGRCAEVTEMNGIEGSPEYADPLTRRPTRFGGN